MYESPSSRRLTQVNDSNGTARWSSRVMRLLDPQPGERIADLSAAVGNFSCRSRGSGERDRASRRATHWSRGAREAAANGLIAQVRGGVLFHSRIDASRAFDKVLLDPPARAREAVKRIAPPGPRRRIVYVSCDPATLARDAGVLVHTKGFTLEAAGVVNMFPHTAHIESVALFER